MGKQNRDIKEIIGENITKLRKQAHLTQAELAEQLNYSDKAISKWERGESSPDPDSLLALSQIFNVHIDYLFYENKQEQFVKKHNQTKIRSLLVSILFCIAALFISLTVFLIAWFRNPDSIKTFWVSFVYAAPIISFILYRYYNKCGSLVMTIIFSSLILWSGLTVIFLQLLILGFNAWMIFFIGVPIQGAIIIYHFVKN